MVNKNGLFVVVHIKESRGEFSPVIDKFKGSPEEVVSCLAKKYCKKSSLKAFFDWWAEPFNVLDEEWKKL